MWYVNTVQPSKPLTQWVSWWRGAQYLEYLSDLESLLMGDLDRDLEPDLDERDLDLEYRWYLDDLELEWERRCSWLCDRERDLKREFNPRPSNLVQNLNSIL